MEVLPDPESSTQVIVHLSASLLSPRFPRQPFRTGPTAVVGDEFHTTFALVIEPLILGVLPRTAVPALGWIVIFGLGAASVVPYLIRYLESISTVGDELRETGLEKRKSR